MYNRSENFDIKIIWYFYSIIIMSDNSEPTDNSLDFALPIPNIDNSLDFALPIPEINILDTEDDNKGIIEVAVGRL